MIIREIETSNCIIDFNLPFDIKPKTNQSKKIAMKSIYVILWAALILFSCKEKCGCESEPYKTVSEVEANFLHNVGLYIHNEENLFAICNLNIISDEISSIAEGATWEGINVIVSGDLHNRCKGQSLSITPPFITLTKIELPEK
ncbi:MAG: hypothetical protein ACOCXH_12665 [Cyclobacteriaceae bacterium]